MESNLKIVRTDRELEMPHVDASLRELGATLVTLPESITERELTQELVDADLLLTCYAKISRAVIENSPRLRAIIKFGVGVDAIDILAAQERSVPVVNIPDYAEETAKLTRAQILQQAGVAMLAQANALPQNVLALLRG